jgi:hypothetical protein
MSAVNYFLAGIIAYFVNIFVGGFISGFVDMLPIKGLTIVSDPLIFGLLVLLFGRLLESVFH